MNASAATLMILQRNDLVQWMIALIGTRPNRRRNLSPLVTNIIAIQCPLDPHCLKKTPYQDHQSPSSLQIALNVFYICILLTIKVSMNNFVNYWKYTKPMKISINWVQRSTTTILNFPGELLPALQADVHEEQGGLLHHLHRLQVVIDGGDDDSDNDNDDDV